MSEVENEVPAEDSVEELTVEVEVVSDFNDLPEEVKEKILEMKKNKKSSCGESCECCAIQEEALEIEMGIIQLLNSREMKSKKAAVDALLMSLHRIVGFEDFKDIITG